MVNLDTLISPRASDLEAFDEDEATDLKFHVRQCTKRYNALNGRLVTVTRLIWFLCLMAVANLLHL